MRVQELTKQYDGKTVVDGVSFAIPKGKVISLIGVALQTSCENFSNNLQKRNGA